MALIKPTTITLRIDPAVKEGLRLLAEKDHRSLTNMIEVMIREQCKVHHIVIPDHPTLSFFSRVPVSRLLPVYSQSMALMY
jgi:hypothetical protein